MIACDTRAQFWWGRRAKNKQTNGVGNYLHGTWINFIFCHYFQENLKQRRFSKRRASTGNGLFALLSLNFEQILGQIVSLREKTLDNTNLVVPRHIKKKKTYFWLTSVAQKGRCLNSLLTSNVRTVNGTPIMVITGVRLLFLICIKDTGAWFSIKIKGDTVTFIPKGLTTRCKTSTKRHSELGEFPRPWFHEDKM